MFKSALCSPQFSPKHSFKMALPIALVGLSSLRRTWIGCVAFLIALSPFSSRADIIPPKIMQYKRPIIGKKDLKKRFDFSMIQWSRKRIKVGKEESEILEVARSKPVPPDFTQYQSEDIELDLYPSLLKLQATLTLKTRKDTPQTIVMGIILAMPP